MGSEDVLFLGVEGRGALNFEGGEVGKYVTPDGEILDPGPRSPTSVHGVAVGEDSPEEVSDDPSEPNRARTGVSIDGEVDWREGERARHQDVYHVEEEEYDPCLRW